MKPTRLHYFYAHNWPARLWVLAVPFAGAGLMAAALGPVPDLATPLSRAARGYLLLLALGALLGYFIGGLLGVFVLGPLYHHRSQSNGAPFVVGDRVLVLRGRDRGQVLAVMESLDYRGTMRLANGRYYDVLHVIRDGDAQAPR